MIVFCILCLILAGLFIMEENKEKGPVTKDFFKLVLQAARHVEMKEQAGSEEIGKTMEESRPVGVYFTIDPTSVYKAGFPVQHRRKLVR